MFFRNPYLEAFDLPGSIKMDETTGVSRKFKLEEILSNSLGPQISRTAILTSNFIYGGIGIMWAPRARRTSSVAGNDPGASPHEPLSSVQGTSVSHTDVQHRVERMNLLLQTLLHIMVEKGLIQEDEFKEWMDYVDGFDGRADGRLEHEIGFTECPGCSRRCPRRASRCLYCGQKFPSEFLAKGHPSTDWSKIRKRGST